MAQRKASSRSKSGTTRKRTTSRKQQGEISQSWSILLFVLGIVLITMGFIPGESVWAWLRTFLLGVFGFTMYLLGPLLIYLAVLVAMERPVWARVTKSLLVVMMLSGTAVVFSTIDLKGLNFFQAIGLLYENGQSFLGGGVLGGLVGGTLLALCGHPAANILLLILLVAVVMWYLGLTPVDLWNFVEVHTSDWQQEREEARLKRDERNQEWEIRRQEARIKREEWEREEQERRQAMEERAQANRLAMQAEMASQDPHAGFASRFRRRSAVDIDLGPDPEPESSDYLEEQPIPVPVQPTAPTGPQPPSEFETHLFEEEPQQNSDVGFEPYPKPEGCAIEMNFHQSTELEEGDEELDVLQAPVDFQNPAQLNELVQKAMTPDESVAQEALQPLNPAAAATTEQAEPEEPAPPAYQYPPLDLFEKIVAVDDPSVEEEMKKNAEILVGTLESFGVKTRVLDICRGPSVTRYELQPLAGVKISKITGLADDIALNLAAAGVRIEAPIPGKPAVGVEVPNRKSSPVGIRGIFESQTYARSASPLTLALGKDIAGNAQVADLCKMPHLLIAGSTGSGKSVCVNSIIISFLYKSSPEDVKLILIDPKVVELAEYNGIPHLLMPVVTEPRKAAGALGSAVAEMERRYREFAARNVRDIKSYNRLAAQQDDMEKMPYIAIVIDELADLMMVAGKEVEDYICRIAQKARAAGMHLIVATQRPSVDVITGLIKANIPSRIAFAVSSQVDSRTILDAAGAEKLLGMGDMLFMPVGASKPLRIQGTYVKDEEISAVLDFIKQSGGAQYDEAMIAEMEQKAMPEKAASDMEDSDERQDPMLEQAIEVVIDAGMASASLLQRRCKLGYARAARLMDEMEAMGVIGPHQGAKPREVLITRQQWIERCMRTDSTQPVPDELM